MVRDEGDHLEGIIYADRKTRVLFIVFSFSFTWLVARMDGTMVGLHSRVEGIEKRGYRIR